MKKSPAKHATKHPAKHAAKHPAKHAAKHAEKHAAKHAEKHAAKKSATHKGDGSRDLVRSAGRPEVALTAAFHHMQRASAVISLVEPETGGDLRGLLYRGVAIYKEAGAAKGAEARRLGLVALGLLQAADHLAMAGLYLAREKHLLDVQAPSTGLTEERLSEVARRLDRLRTQPNSVPERLCRMSRELLKRAEAAGHDAHLRYELAMSADGLCGAAEMWTGA